MLATAIIVAHDEGRQVQTAYESVVRGFESALFSLSLSDDKDKGLQVLFVLDRADDLTAKTVAAIKEDRRTHGGFNLVDSIDVIKTNYGEPGSARNDGVASAEGEIVLLMDGDDLVGRSFVAHGFQEMLGEEAGRGKNGLACHPEYLYYFGEKSVVWKQPTWETYLENYAALLHTNLWDVTMIADRSMLLEHPYLPSSLSSGSGYEDWEWCLYTSAKGIEHRVIPKSIAYKRAKSFGRFIKDSRDNVLINTARIPTNLQFARQ